MDKSLLTDFFAGKSLNQDELESIDTHRKKSILLAGRLYRSREIFQGDAEVDNNFSKHFMDYLENGPSTYTRYTEFITNSLRGKRVIELGPGSKPLAKTLFDLGIKEYVAPELYKPKETKAILAGLQGSVEVIHQDALEFLLTQPDNSAIIISCGFLDTKLLMNYNKDYYRFIGRELFRITPKESPTIHILSDPTHYDLDIFFKEHGFKLHDPNMEYKEIWIKE